MNIESGFTLIEIIVTMVILGILSAIAGMGIITGTKGYLFTKENAHMAQKSQLAMARMSRELMVITNISAKDSTQPDPYIIYDNLSGRHAIAKVGTTIKIFSNLQPTQTELPSGGDVLIDNVDSFTLSYYKGTDAWDGSDIRLLSVIVIDLSLSRSESGMGNISLSTTVHPRNTKNYGGAPPTTSPPTKSNYGCFVATAAYGEQDHPVVLLLRQFRDRCLLTWNGGKAVVRAYYAIGPFIADKIEGRAWACFAAQFILLPFVGVAFFMLYFPAAIPLILIVSWLITRMIFSVVRRRNNIVCHTLSDNREGSVLIGLIVTMVVISSIGAAMVSLTSTSIFSQVGGNSSERAYFLAESGYRYSASRYLNAADETAKDSELVAMHTQQTYTLLNDNGQFKLQVYPYYFKSGSPTTPPTTTLNTVVPGGFPPGLTLPGRLKIGSKFFNCDSATQSGPNVTFTMSAPIPPIPAGMDVLSVAISSNNTQTVIKGGDLYLDSNGYAGAFPLLNGTINVKGHVYSYERVDHANNCLTGIDDPADPNMSDFDVEPNTDIVLQKFVKLHSTGIFGQGPMQAQRKIVYHVPLPTSSTGEKEEFHDTFENKEHWHDSTLGSHEIQITGGDKALKVTGIGDVADSTDDKGSLITLDWAKTNVDLASAHVIAGHYLSYDAQVKVGFDPLPPWQINGTDFPEYYMAGLSFRQKNNGDSYGLSFVRGDNAYVRESDSITDGIPDDFVPQNDWPMIVLWQQTDSGSEKTWLAYKYLTGPVFFSDDMESGTTPDWTAEIPWEYAGTRCHSGTTCWTCSPSGVTVEAALESQIIDISGATPTKLSFWHWYEIDESEGLVEISVDDGVWQEIATYTGDLSGVTNSVPVELDLSSYLGAGNPEKIVVRFRLCSDPAKIGDGWYIDDVKIYENFPINEATLLIRVREAASLGFVNGSGATMVDGDCIVGTTSGAKGTVHGTPILSSGSWGDGDAAGIIMLNNVSGSFQNAEPLLVLGALTVAQATEFSVRDNYLRAYYGDVNGYGTPNNNPLDYKKLGNPRNPSRVNWPPDEVEETEAGNDYFTLVAWDAVNEVDSSVECLGIGKEQDAVIRTNAITTTDSGIFGQPEIGLHTFGYSSTNVYFDDFAIQAEVSAIITTFPIQE